MEFNAKDENSIKELYQDCLNGQKRSYAPYSKANVGACLWTKDKKKFYGANIENASYGLTVCAERNAMFSYVLNGAKKEDIIVLGIVANFKGYAWPCGACRQVMAELLKPSTVVVIFDQKGDYKVSSVEELLPYSFTQEDLN